MKILGEATKQELKDFLYYGMNYEDKKLYEEVCKNQANIFQFSGGTAAGMIQRAQPQNFDDLTSINALSRPGSSFCFDDFVANGDSHSKYPEIISENLKGSHGCILFQEQIMQLCEKLSNGKVKGDYARKLLKKLGKANKKQADIDAWEKMVKTIKKESKAYLTDEELEMFTSDLLTLSAYSFNKSHAAAYTYVACETLYMTKYFRPYFWAASLTYDATKLDALKTSIKNAQKEGFKILPPDINTSNIHFTPLKDGIRFGLNEIKGVGEVPCEAIIKNRPYNSIKEFIIKNLDTKINKKVTTALVGGGAFDNLIPEKQRKKYLKITEEFYEKKKTKKNPELLGELWDDIEQENELISETSVNEFMEYEKIYLGGNFFHGIFSDIMREKIEKLYNLHKCLRSFEEVREKDKPTAYVPVQVKAYRYHTQKNFQEMCFLTCEDMNGEEVTIPVFGSYWEIVKVKFFAEGFYLLSVFDKDGQIMFGSRNWVTNPDTKRAMMIRWKIS